MRQTENFKLALYDTTDKFNITGEENSLNANTKVIDEVLKENVEKVATAASNIEQFKKDTADEVAGIDSAQQKLTDEFNRRVGNLFFSLTEDNLLHISALVSKEA